MAHTHVCNLVHVVFSTKGRARLLGKELQPRVWSYIGGIARKNNFRALAVGGTSDHIHALFSLPADMPVSKAVQLVKGGSSKWLNDNGNHFAWQEGYAAFSVSNSQTQRVLDYINSQEEHHKKRNYENELRILLKAHGIEFDEKFVFG
jgi:REP element-mobilizing transposase RayT